eukprot:TRINITY_DN1133_c0_g4_i2.p1 TRINITY_DN1133_c0_g4~~TRINITY_DN1133_c0_g4_i2.p1  ORF type:complete len:356 (-),score=40.33 TRINITY_DN1133_c0_g4_i2:165-1232(-)
MEEVLSSNAIINREETVPVLYLDASSELNDKLRKIPPPSNIFVNFAKNVLIIDGEELRFDLVRQDQSKRADCYAEENQEYHFRGPILQKISMKRTLRPEDRANYKNLTRTEELKKHSKKTVALDDQLLNTGNKKDLGKRRVAPTRAVKTSRTFIPLTTVETETRTSSSPEATWPSNSTPSSKKGQKRPLSPISTPSNLSSNGNSSNTNSYSTSSSFSETSVSTQHHRSSTSVSTPSSNGTREKAPNKYPRLSVPKPAAPSTSPTSTIPPLGTTSTIGRSNSQGAQKPGDVKLFVIRLLISENETTEGIEAHCQGKGWTKAELTRVLKQVATLRQNSKWELKEEFGKEILTEDSFT